MHTIMQKSLTQHLKNMKRLFLLLTVVLAFDKLPAQNSGDKLYGFVQPVLPGAAAARRIADDAGNVSERKPADVRLNYFIYLATAKADTVYDVEMWIRGKAFSALPKIVDTPVELTSNLVPGRPQKKVLVPKTTQKVIQLEPTELAGKKTNGKAARLAQQAELVVVYKQEGKTYIKTLKALSELSPKALQ